MEHTILIVEPNAERGKEIVHLLMRSGYDTLLVPDAEGVLRQLYAIHPDAVIVSNQLSAAEMGRLSHSVTTISDLPIIELADEFPLFFTTRCLTCSAATATLVEILDKLFDRSTQELNSDPPFIGTHTTRSGKNEP